MNVISFFNIKYIIKQMMYISKIIDKIMYLKYDLEIDLCWFEKFLNMLLNEVIPSLIKLL